MPLETYRKITKRDFDQTPEPAGRVRAASNFLQRAAREYRSNDSRSLRLPLRVFPLIFSLDEATTSP
jgi:hypothetical protein